MPYLPKRNGGKLMPDCQETAEIASRPCSESATKRSKRCLEIAEAGFVRNSGVHRRSRRKNQKTQDARVDNSLVLIVEDEPVIAQILEGYLSRDGFRTVRASDGETALQHHALLKPDIVLLDVRLPKLDGFGVLGRLRQAGSTPVIMVTAVADDIDRLSGLRLGADDYVVKPFNPQEVVARVRAVLRRTQGDRAETIKRFGDS
jgi:CheY-like chemotaxis protein